MPRQLTFEQIEDRITAIGATERLRALTAAERDELYNLIDRRDQRRRRVHDQIADAEAKLHRLRSIAKRLAA